MARDPATQRRWLAAAVLGVGYPVAEIVGVCADAGADPVGAEACRWVTTWGVPLTVLQALVFVPLAYGALTLLAVLWARARARRGHPTSADPAPPAGAATLVVAHGLIYAGALLLTALGALWVFALFVVPQTEAYAGVGMMAALLPFRVLPVAVPLLAAGVGLRAWALRPRGR